MASWLKAIKLEWLLFGLVFVSHAYFYNSGGWNQNARLDGIFAFVEPGTPDYLSFRINRFLPDPSGGVNTGDWARSGESYYSNKAPGTQLLGIPVYFMLFHIEQVLGLDPAALDVTVFNSYVINLFVSVLWTALATVALFMAAGDRRTEDALWIAAVYGFATLAFPFDTQLWGHTTAAAMCLIGYHFLRSGRLVFSGLMLGAALMVDYLAAISMALALGFLVYQRARPEKIGRFVLGAMPGTLALLAYQKACFGGWLTTATSMSNPMVIGGGTDGGLFGDFSPAVILKLLLSVDRGLLVYSPVLGFSLYGAYLMIQRAETREWAWLCVANIVCVMLMLAGFPGWHGGWSSGPRYMISTLPFWCFLLPRLSELDRSWRAPFYGAFALSAFNMLVIAAVTPLAPNTFENPLYGALYEKFMAGELAVVRFGVRLFTSPEEAGHTAFNLGSWVLGLPFNLLSLVPWLVSIGAGFHYLRRRIRS
jgi:hypothetical protein